MRSKRDWPESAINAMLRARGRVRLQQFGGEFYGPAHVSLEALGTLCAPHELLPYEHLRHEVMAKKLTRGQIPQVRRVLQ